MSAFVPKADIDSIKETLTCAVQTPREALSKTAGFRNPGAAADNKRPLPKPGQDLDRAKAMGVSLFAGEAEGRLDEGSWTLPPERSSRSIIIWTITVEHADCA
jgi:hypothetical protein